MIATYLVQKSTQIDPEFLNSVHSFLEKHGEMIVRKHNPYCYAGNWGVLENHGLFLLGVLLPKNEKIQNFQRQAISVLTKALDVQILPDGVQVEQSAMYHNEVLRCMLEVIYFARIANIRLDIKFVKKVYKMAYATRYMLKPDGNEFANGDSDVMNMRSILQMVAVLFRDGRLKFTPDEDFSYETFMLFGEEEREIFLS